MSDIDHRLAEALETPGLRFSLFLSKNQKILWLALGLFAASMSFLYFSVRKGDHRQKDFIAFESLKKSINLDSTDDLEKLSPYMKKYPETALQVESFLARALMYKNDIALGSSLVTKSATEGLFVNSYYLDFSKISFLIQERQFGEALTLAVDLQNRILEDRTFWEDKKVNSLFGADLVLFNQLRIAMIFKELGNASEELKALIDLKSMVSDGTIGGFSSIPKESIARFQAHFLSGSLSLLDYISSRERVLGL